MWRHSLNMPNVFIVFHYYFNNVFVQIHIKESQQLQKVNIRAHGSKASCDEETYGDSHSSEKVMKRRNQT
jgi:hypothetical protein